MNAFFQNLSTDSRTKVLKFSRQIHFNYKDEQVCFLGNGQVFILESGCLMTIRSDSHGKKIGIDILKTGDLLGICQLFNSNYENIISILPLSHVCGYIISVENMSKRVKENHDISIAVISQFSTRFINVINHFATNALGSSKDKLNYALSMTNSLQTKQLTHEELAVLSGLNRVTVSKIINEVLNDMNDININKKMELGNHHKKF